MSPARRKPREQLVDDSPARVAARSVPIPTGNGAAGPPAPAAPPAETHAERPDDFVPPAPPTLGSKPLGPEATAAWEGFWRSQISRAVDVDADLPALTRWAFTFDEWVRAMRALRRVRVVAGSMGQPTMTPLAGYLNQLGTELERLERSLGMRPKFRLDMGFTYQATRLTAERLNALLDRDGADDFGDWTPS